MTGLLASVRNPAEAQLALDGGADIVDLKEPARGALGALPLDVIRAAVALVGGRKPVSATIGDLPMEPRQISDAVARTAATGVDFVKIGVFPNGEPEACIDALEAQALSGSRLIALLFADRRPDFSLLQRAADRGFAGVMLDTMGKTSGGLRNSLDDVRLRQFVDGAHERGLIVGLAGSLKREDIPALLPLGADYLGFRGALCRGSRADDLDPEALQGIRAMIGHGDSSSKATETAGALSAAASLIAGSPATRLPKST